MALSQVADTDDVARATVADTDDVARASLVDTHAVARASLVDTDAEARASLADTDDVARALLVDTHCHLDARQFADESVAGVLARAHAAGVTRVVTIGVDEATSRKARGLAEAHDGLFATVGVDPNDLGAFTADTPDQLRELAQSDWVVGIGEIGLDYYWNRSPRDEQLRAFEAQLGLARSLGLPVVVHDRDAHEDTLAVLLAWASDSTWSDRPLGVMHCYSGDVAMAERLAGCGYLISLAGNVTFPKADALHEVARSLPLESLVLETDAPYLAPQPKRGTRNEPANVRWTAEHVARLRGEPFDTVADATSRNAARLFRWNGDA